MISAPGFATPDLAAARERVATALLARQNADGGFGYRPGGMSFADATAWSMLALAGRGGVFARARSFLETCRRGDGCAAFAGDPERSWMTAPVLLALQSRDATDTWAAGCTSYLIEEARARSEPGKSARGWPWSNGCAPWVEPTALTVFALAHAGRADHPRVREGLGLIADNGAKGGGWSLYAQRPHLYHTGLVLLACHAVAGARAAAGLATPTAGPTPTALDAGRRWLAANAAASRSPLDLGVAALALEVHGDPAAPGLLTELAARVADPNPRVAPPDTLALAFALLALRTATGDPATPLLAPARSGVTAPDPVPSPSPGPTASPR